MNIIQIGILSVAGVLLALQMKTGREEYGIYITLAVGLCIFAGIADNLSLILEITGLMKEILGENGIYVEVLIKMLGITYVAEFSAGICRDAGYQTVAAQIEIFAKITILALSMPILLALLKTIRTFLV
ncbi:stage III sporulation protein AD [Faecalicatena sp. Marseille-Q4148]|nr:stage III sporulation protein AD [Faecalicatena sp. Marseille-Q4148]